MSTSSSSSAAVAGVRGLLALPTDQARLDALKNMWTTQSTDALAALVREAAKQMADQANQYSSSTSVLSASSSSSLRALLGLTSLLARREYPPVASAKAGLSLPAEVFPGVVASLVILLEAVERPVAGESGDAAAGGAASPAQTHQVKFHSLHAFNRILEGFPEVAGVFAKVVLDQCERELFPDASSVGASLSPAYATKLLETLGLLISTFPRGCVAQSHVLLEKCLRCIEKNLEGVDEWVKEEPDMQEEEEEEEAAAAKKPAKLPTQLSAAHSFTLSLLDFSSTLLRRIHVRLPVAYPSARQLLPRAWPFGSEDLEEKEEGEDGGKGGEGEEDDGGEDDNGIEEEDEEETDDGSDASSSAPFVVQPRQCFTEPLHANPVRKGAQPMSLTPSQASDLFGSLLSRLAVFHQKVGVESGSSARGIAPGTMNEHGATILGFLPLVVALENLYCNAEETSRMEHGRHVEGVCESLLDQLRSLEFLTPNGGRFLPMLATAAHQTLTTLEGVLKYADRRACVDFAPTLYNDLVNWLGDAQAAFPRQAFIKLRRYAVQAFMGVLYTLDDTFQSAIGSSSFFSELFPLLANPLLTSHLVWLLRAHPEHLTKKVLPQVMRGLLNTKTKGSPSMKTVVLILTSIGNVACFLRAIENGEGGATAAGGEEAKADGAIAPSGAVGAAVLPVLAPYMEQLLETIIGTMEKSPSGTGQVASLVLCRIVLAAYDMAEVQNYLPRILTLYRRVLDESLFVAEQADQGEEYDEDDQDLVSQLQYCVLDMLHVFFQDQREAALDPIARGGVVTVSTDSSDAPHQPQHPFQQANFVRIVGADEDSVQAVREIMQVLMENTKKPIFFNDDGALRNSEIHLVKEVLAHPSLMQSLLTPPPPESPEEQAAAADEAAPPAAPLPPLTPESLVLTLLASTIAAKEDGQAERKYNYALCLTSLTSSLTSDLAFLQSVRSALADPAQQKLMATVRKDAELARILAAAGWAK